MRKTEFFEGEYYHIYNRGVEKRNIFTDKYDYVRLIKTLRLFNTEKPTGGLHYLELQENLYSDLVATKTPLVTIVAYCLNPNHYHLILREEVSGGISKFIKKVIGGYVWYYNKRHDRSGSLFQGPFKAVHVDSNEYLLYLSAYVNTNNFIHNYRDDKSWPYSSWLDYIGQRDGDLCDKNIILSQFGDDTESYKEFVEMNARHLRDKKALSKYLLE